MLRDVNRSGEMEVFVAVVEAGSFSEAARRLDMSPSAVSKLVSRLEARLGTRLFNRSTRSIDLRTCLENRSDVFQALDVDARAEGPDGQDHPQDETLPV